MMSDYYNPCSFLEPIIEFFPCGPYSQQLPAEEDDGGTPKRSNRSPNNEAFIKSTPSAMSTSTDTSSYHQENISSLQKVSPHNRNYYNAGYDHHPYHHHHQEQRQDADYAPVPFQYGDQSPWHPPLTRPDSWHDSEKCRYGNNNYWQPPHQQPHQHLPAPPPQQQHWEQGQAYPSHATAAEEPAGTSREEQCPTPSSVSTELTNSIESKRDLRTLDICCGRGAPTNFHYGNQVFRELVEDHQTSYLCGKRSDKPQIAMKLMDLVKATGGRFVRRQRTAEGLIWQEINDKGAYEKICQALRDGAPDLRRQVLSKVKKSSKSTVDGKENNGK
jgi:hypothetical protein